MKESLKVRTSKFATASFVAGISTLVFYGASYKFWDSGVFGIVLTVLTVAAFPLMLSALGLILGIVAIIEIKRRKGTVKGKAWAIVGIILGPIVWLLYLISEFS